MTSEEKKDIYNDKNEEALEFIDSKIFLNVIESNEFIRYNI